MPDRFPGDSLEEETMGNNHSPRWAFMQRLDIPDTNDPSRVYLRRRRIIQTPWFGILWHHIFLRDSDRDPHDHPWPFASFVVRGGYSEKIYPAPWSTLDYCLTRHWKRFSWHIVDTKAAHQVTDVSQNTITLVLTGRRSREWGFWTSSGFVQWRSYRQSS